VTRQLRLTLSGRRLTMPVRRDRRARRITIHIDVAIGGAKVVMPVSATISEAEAAVRKHESWVLDRLDALPARVAFADGALVPFRGELLRVVHCPEARGLADCVGDEIRVFGRSEHLARRLGDWLRHQARDAISPLALEKAAIVDRRVRRVSIRDQRSRWGSCSEAGSLTFNWRLILAPHSVLDYVVAHEIAHLVEMNHSPAFWRVVGTLTPHTKEARQWLRLNGQDLYRYG
jgi:predicted metal-dependent hydrolase